MIKAGVTPHFLPVFVGEEGRPSREKGIDVWLALEAFDLTRGKELNVVVLVTGDGDYVPLARKLNGLGTRVMVTAWDFAGHRVGTTRAAQTLIDEVTYPVMMSTIVDDRARRFDPLVANLFVQRSSPGAASGPVTRAEASDNDMALSGDDALGADERAAGPRIPPRSFGNHPNDAPDARAQGWVANIPYGRDFGFIEPVDGDERLFFHQTWVVGCSFSELQQGDRVEFTLESNPRDGRPVARRVTRPPPMMADPELEEEDEAELDEDEPADD